MVFPAAMSTISSLFLAIQVAAPAGLLGPPLNEGRGIVGSDSYPPGAMRRHEQGTTVIAFSVSPDGRVHDCTIEHSSGFAELDTASCVLFAHRARFTPKPDSNGVDQRTLSVQWRLPD